jgi:beta-glucosidase
VARESLVLLKNANSVLPAAVKIAANIAIVGPNADNGQVYLGNYQGNPSKLITVLDAFKTYHGANINYSVGCNGIDCPDSSLFSAAITAAEGADVIIAVMGLDQTIASEGHDW